MDKKVESYEDLFISRLLFIRALGELIPEGHGIFLIVDKPEYDLNKIIVMNDESTIRVFRADERNDLKNGDMVVMIDGNILSN